MLHEGGWTLIRDSNQFRQAIKNGLADIEAISFDSDLGQGSDDGYKLLDEIERMVIDGGQPLPKLMVHSMNPVAVKRMLGVIERLNNR